MAQIPGGGLKFSTPDVRSKSDLGGIAFTAVPLRCLERIDCREGELSLEIWLAADSEASSCLKRILDLRRPDGSEAFYIGQWKSEFIVRTFNSRHAASGRYREVGLRQVLSTGRQSVLTVTSNGAGTHIYVNGRPAAQYPGLQLLQEGQKLEGHRLYLGNAPDLGCSWPREVFGLAPYDRALTSGEVCEAGGRRRAWGGTGAVACWSLADGAGGDVTADLSGSMNVLDIPRHLVFVKQFLGWAALRHLPLSDLVLNLLGFVPFGLLVSLRITAAGRLSIRSCGLATLALGFGVSLLIETVQVFLPGRDSSLLDLVANTVGTAAGALIALVVFIRCSRVRGLIKSGHSPS